MGTISVPDLPYPYDALEPHIDARTMEVHHATVHRRYVEGLNRALQGSDKLQELAAEPIDDLLWNFGKVPEEWRASVRNHGGGHANHSLLWSILSPDGGGDPSGPLADAIVEEFGSVDEMKRRVSAVAEAHIGSGWVWLVRSRTRLIAYSLPNEDSPLTAEEVPILGIDLWEHAYYLRYQADRQAYVDAFWNVVDWQEVGRRFEAAGT